MPTYDYACDNCGHQFEIFQNMSDEPITECPICMKSIRRIIYGGTGVIFKGGGFYVTDSKSNTSSTSVSSNSPQPVRNESTDNKVSDNKVSTSVENKKIE